MPNERVTRSFAAKLGQVPGVLEFVISEASSRGLSPQRLMHLELSVEEAAVNTCRYAYPQGEGTLEVSVWEEAGHIMVELADAGVAFDPLAKADPDLDQPLENRPVGGLGIHLIRRVTDGVDYRRTGDRNVLTLAFNKERR